jgi:hypothetical protein
MTKTLTTFRDLKKGQKFIVVSNSNGHNYPLNKVLTLKMDGMGHTTQMSDCIMEQEGRNTLDIKDVRLPNNGLSDLHQEVVELQEKLDLTNEKIKLCNDLGLTEYDENVIKVHKALAVIKTKKTDIEKAQDIANLIAEIAG